MPRTIILDTPKGKRTVVIPKGMRVEETSRVYVDMLLLIVQHFMKRDGRGLIDALKTSDGTYFVLHINVVDDHVFWTVEPVLIPRRIVAGGFFQKEDGYWQEARAAAVPHMRGRGLYKAVLRRIRAFLGHPIVSDTQLSAANVCVWVAVGGVPEDKHNAFRINPKRNLTKSIARCILALETTPC